MTEQLRDLVARRRREMGLTQEELSERSGMSQEWMSKVERGEIKIPRWSSLRRLATALDVPFEEIVVAAGFATTRARAKVLTDRAIDAIDSDDDIAETWLPVLRQLNDEDRRHLLRTARLILRGYEIREGSPDIPDASN